MLIKLFVENFKSFDSRTEFNMLTSSKIRDKDSHVMHIKKLKLLKHAVIYGANAAGKSNFIEVFDFIRFCVERKIPFGSSNLFCKLRKENENRNSTFEIIFTIREKVYDYGFSLLFSERKIIEEWLYELDSSKTPKCIFECSSNNKPVLGLKDLNEEDINRFNTYAEDYQDLTSTLFLTELNRNKKYMNDSALVVFKDVYTWITKNLIIFKPDTLITNFEYFYEDKSLEKINRLIKAFDTGITEARIENISIDELNKRLPPEIFQEVISDMKEILDNNKTSKISMRSSDQFFNIVINKTSDPIITTIKLKHDKSYFDYDFNEESDGTRRLFDLIDMLLMNKDDVVFVVDELERSLHPKLTACFLKLFDSLHVDNNIQLIFSTHESTIMDQALFRRDEIWFIERDENNSSKLYSLDRFKERYDKRLSKAYLEGRYGAIPIFKEFTSWGEN